MSGGRRVLHVGIISDTHGLLRPEAVRELSGADRILHAGDVGDPTILDRLREIAPVTAIRGNVDVSGACAQLPATEAVELDGCLFYLVHAVQDLDIVPAAAGVKVVVYGHSHRPEVKDRDGIVYLNPGSAGPAAVRSADYAGPGNRREWLGAGTYRPPEVCWSAQLSE